MIRSFKRGVGIASVLLAVGACSVVAPDGQREARRIGTARTAWGAGATGDGNITFANAVLNFYSNVTADLAVGDKTINVGNMADLGPPAVGDLVMVMQMQGATIDQSNNAGYGAVTDLGHAGTFEFVHIQAVSGNTLTIEDGCGGLKNAYSAAGHTQVIRVPEYKTLTLADGASIVPLPWDGTRGGVVVIRASGAITLNGSSFIDASGAGFRGGEVDNANSSLPGPDGFRGSAAAGGAHKGEGIAGFTAEYTQGSFGRGAPANGGGGGNAHNAGGGGGANGVATAGDWSGQGVMTGVYATDPWRLDDAFIANGNARTTSIGGGRGGYTYAADDQDAVNVAPGDTSWNGDDRREVGGWGGRPLNQGPQGSEPIRYFLGGGGGAGDSNNDTGTPGPNGGGLIFIEAGSLTGASNNSIRSNGNSAATTSGAGNDAPGGGGAGGTIVIVSPSLTGVVLDANGGKGGDQAITLATES
jgi:hypothetical protein